MSAPGLSAAEWASVAALTPRLRSGTEVFRHRYRGQPWYIVKDPVSGRHHRFGAEVYRVIGAMDGTATMGDLYHRLSAELGDAAPQRDELASIVAQLRAMSLLELNIRRDAAALFDRIDRARRPRWLQWVSKPLAIRIPLLDPDPLLSRLAPIGRLLFTPAGVVAWLALLIPAIFVALERADDLATYASTRLGDPAMLLTMYMVYPTVKLLHEFGHGLALKRWGGEAHDSGLMLLALVPVPFIDASAANAIAERRARVIIGAAGMLFETALAAAALLVWSVVEPGQLQDFAFTVALIGGVSTVVFNANPLLRYDGYYVLADAVQIPALATRAKDYYAWLVKRYLFGVADAISPVTAPGERKWFIAYAPAAVIYRITVMLAITVWLADTVPLVGVLLAGWMIVSTLVWPVVKQFAYVFASVELGQRRWRAVLCTTLLTALAGYLLVAVPVPVHTSASGYVKPADGGAVRAEHAGVITAVYEPHGTAVRAGAALLKLEDAPLSASVRELAARVDELEARRVRSLRRETAASLEHMATLAAARDELTRQRERLAALVVRAPRDGRVNLVDQSDLLGRYVTQGDVLANIVSDEALIVRAVVPQTRIALVRDASHAVQVRLAPWPERTFSAIVSRAPPGASMELPSAVLGSQGGGDIPVDARDAGGRRALEPVFEIDLIVSADVARFEGAPARVRFEHQAEPLARQALRMLRQTFLAHLAI